MNILLKFQAIINNDPLYNNVHNVFFVKCLCAYLFKVFLWIVCHQQKTNISNAFRFKFFHFGCMCFIFIRVDASYVFMKHENLELWCFWSLWMCVHGEWVMMFCFYDSSFFYVCNDLRWNVSCWKCGWSWWKNLWCEQKFDYQLVKCWECTLIIW